VTELQELLETSMNKEVFGKINQPSLTLYYYKDEAHQDPQVSVSAMIEMNAQLATPAELKVTKAMPDAGAHVLGSSLTSKDVQGVYNAIEDFALEKLGMTKVNAQI
jgi:hypothetical protein